MVTGVQQRQAALRLLTEVVGFDEDHGIVVGKLGVYQAGLYNLLHV